MKIIKISRALFKIGTLLSSVAVVGASLSSCSVLTYESSVQIIVSDSSSTLADQSFSESTYDGFQSFMKWATGVETPNVSEIKENSGIWKKPGDDDDTRLLSYKYAVTNGSRLIAAVGYNHQNALQNLTSIDQEYSYWKDYFKNTGFIFLDGSMYQKTDSYNSIPYNVASISYRADDGSFLAGISTAVFLNLYSDYFSRNGNLGVSAFVGLALPTTLNYMNGFRLGIHYWNTILQPLITKVDDDTSTKKINWVSSTSSYDISSFTSGSFSSTESKATTLTSNFRANGANAIFPIAGPQASLVIDQIASNPRGSSGRANTIVIGVDSAQENISTYQTKLSTKQTIGNGQILQFSSIKNLTTSTENILKAIVNGENNSNSTAEWKGLGWNNVGTISNASVGVSDAGLKYLIDPFFWSESNTPNTSDLLTWSNSETKNLTLKQLLGIDALVTGKTTTKYVAQKLDTNDNVISKYASLLAGNITTPTSITLSENKITLGEETSSKGASSQNGINGWDGTGNWEIKNNLNGVNNYLTLTLSSMLPGISGATYTVANNTAKWVGGDGSQKVTRISKEDMFFRG